MKELPQHLLQRWIRLRTINLPRGIRFALDVGTARIGVARCDPDATMAFPVSTIKAGSEAVSELAGLIAEYEPLAVYIGLPMGLKGNVTASTQMAIDFGKQLHSIFEEKEISLHVAMVDERLSTVSATNSLQAAGRNSKNSREFIDQAAAVVILEQALAIEKSTSKLAGISIEDYK